MDQLNETEPTILAIEALRIALQKETPDEEITVILECLGRMLSGERTYIFERNEQGNDDNTYEWVEDGIVPEKPFLQNLPAEVCANWYQNFARGKNIIIKDIEDIRKSDPLQHENLKRQDIHSLCVVPLYNGKDAIGFLGVDNPSDRYLDKSTDILQMMADFIMATIKRRDLIARSHEEEADRAAVAIATALAERTQENLDMVNEIIGSGLWYMDFSEQGEMTRVFWSQPFREMLGFRDTNDFPDVLESWSDRLHPKDKAATMAAYWDCVAGNSEYNVQYRLMKRNGEYDWFHAHGRVARHQNGMPRLFLGTFINITKDLKAKQALEEACEAANRANAAKTEFLASMSHDMRTPLNGIIGMTAIAEANLSDMEKVRHCLSQITVSSKHLLGLINEILDMNKLESGKVSLNPENFNMTELIDNFLAMSKPLIEGKHHEFSLDAAGVVHENVCGDCGRIQQCLMNFMSNAVKYTPENGKIRLIICERPTSVPNASGYEFVFEDNGIGMDESFIPSLFEPFVRSDDECVRAQQGTGLGMAITRNLIRMMNGDIHVESKRNEGSRFTVTIVLKLQDADSTTHPLGNEEAEEDRENCASSDNCRIIGKWEEKNALQQYGEKDFRGRRVLLAEDNELNAEIISEILGMTGLEVTHAWNGKEAVDLLLAAEDGDYDLVFMDIQMPVMNGYEAAKAIRTTERAYMKRIPIIALSANAFDEDIRRAISSGMNGHLAKPLDFGSLLAVMNQWIPDFST